MQRVAAGEKHIPDGRGLGDIVNGLLQAVPAWIEAAVAHHPGPGAVAAVGGAKVQDQQQDPVRIAMHQARNRALGIFPQGVVRLSDVCRQFLLAPESPCGAGAGPDRSGEIRLM